MQVDRPGPPFPDWLWGTSRSSTRYVLLLSFPHFPLRACNITQVLRTCPVFYRALLSCSQFFSLQRRLFFTLPAPPIPSTHHVFRGASDHRFSRESEAGDQELLLSLLPNSFYFDCTRQFCSGEGAPTNEPRSSLPHLLLGRNTLGKSISSFVRLGVSPCPPLVLRCAWQLEPTTNIVIPLSSFPLAHLFYRMCQTSCVVVLEPC